MARHPEERKVEKVELFKPVAPVERERERPSSPKLKLPDGGTVLGFVGKALKKGADILDSAFPDNKPKGSPVSPDAAMMRLNGARPPVVVQDGKNVLIVREGEGGRPVEVVQVKTDSPADGSAVRRALESEVGRIGETSDGKAPTIEVKAISGEARTSAGEKAGPGEQGSTSGGHGRAGDGSSVEKADSGEPGSTSRGRLVAGAEDKARELAAAHEKALRLAEAARASGADVSLTEVEQGDRKVVQVKVAPPKDPVISVPSSTTQNGNETSVSMTVTGTGQPPVPGPRAPETPPADAPLPPPVRAALEAAGLPSGQDPEPAQAAIRLTAPPDGPLRAALEARGLPVPPELGKSEKARPESPASVPAVTDTAGPAVSPEARVVVGLTPTEPRGDAGEVAMPAGARVVVAVTPGQAPTEPLAVPDAAGLGVPPEARVVVAVTPSQSSPGMAVPVALPTPPVESAAPDAPVTLPEAGNPRVVVTVTQPGGGMGEVRTERPQSNVESARPSAEPRPTDEGERSKGGSEGRERASEGRNEKSEPKQTEEARQRAEEARERLEEAEERAEEASRSLAQRAERVETTRGSEDRSVDEIERAESAPDARLTEPRSDRAEAVEEWADRLEAREARAEQKAEQSKARLAELQQATSGTGTREPAAGREAIPESLPRAAGEVQAGTSGQPSGNEGGSRRDDGQASPTETARARQPEAPAEPVARQEPGHPETPVTRAFAPETAGQEPGQPETPVTRAAVPGTTNQQPSMPETVAPEPPLTPAQPDQAATRATRPAQEPRELQPMSEGTAAQEHPASPAQPEGTAARATATEPAEPPARLEATTRETHLTAPEPSQAPAQPEQIATRANPTRPAEPSVQPETTAARETREPLEATAQPATRSTQTAQEAPEAATPATRTAPEPAEAQGQPELTATPAPRTAPEPAEAQGQPEVTATPAPRTRPEPAEAQGQPEVTATPATRTAPEPAEAQGQPEVTATPAPRTRPEPAEGQGQPELTATGAPQAAREPLEAPAQPTLTATPAVQTVQEAPEAPAQPKLTATPAPLTAPEPPENPARPEQTVTRAAQPAQEPAEVSARPELATQAAPPIQPELTVMRTAQTAQDTVQPLTTAPQATQPEPPETPAQPPTAVTQATQPEPPETPAQPETTAMRATKPAAPAQPEPTAPQATQTAPAPARSAPAPAERPPVSPVPDSPEPIPASSSAVQELPGGPLTPAPPNLAQPAPEPLDFVLPILPENVPEQAEESAATSMPEARTSQPQDPDGPQESQRANATVVRPVIESDERPSAAGYHRAEQPETVTAASSTQSQRVQTVKTPEPVPVAAQPESQNLSGQNDGEADQRGNDHKPSAILERPTPKLPELKLAAAAPAEFEQAELPTDTTDAFIATDTPAQATKLEAVANRHAAGTVTSLLKKANPDLPTVGDLDEDSALHGLGLIMKMAGGLNTARSQRVQRRALSIADELGVKDFRTRKEIRQGSMLSDIGQSVGALESADEDLLSEMGSFLEQNPELNLRTLHQATVLRDVGQIVIPESIRSKTSDLTDDETALLRTHPQLGEEIVGVIPSLKHLAPIIRSHHERWDGGGYPDGLKGTRIPLASRIIAVADVFEGLLDRPDFDIDQARQVMRDGAGSAFDPVLIRAFERILDAGT